MEITQRFPKVITLNVGGNIFTTTLSTLLKDSDSMLATMFSGRHDTATDAEGRYFIDRDGTYFGYIIDYLRDNLRLPPSAIALKVYTEAEFYQVEGLRSALETFPDVFAAKLEKTKKRLYRLDHWKYELVEQSQKKCLSSLRSTSSVCFMSSEDYAQAKDDSVCTRGEHDPFVTRFLKESKDKAKAHSESFDSVSKKIKQVDVVISDVKQKEMNIFIQLLEQQYKREGYRVSIVEDSIRCKNYQMIYGYGKEVCKFGIHCYTIEFDWST